MPQCPIAGDATASPTPRHTCSYLSYLVLHAVISLVTWVSAPPICVARTAGLCTVRLVAIALLGRSAAELPIRMGVRSATHACRKRELMYHD